MSRIFLGRPVHWLIVLALAILGWIGGRSRLHVIEFNLFIVLTIVAVIVALIVVIATTRPGERVTRDPIIDE